MSRLVPVLALLLCLLAGCAPFSGPIPRETPPSSVFVQHSPSQGDFTYSIDTGAATKSVYFAFTNPDTRVPAASIPSVSGTDALASKGLDWTTDSIPLPAKSAIAATPTRVSEFNRDPFSRTGSTARLRKSLDLTGSPPPPPMPNDIPNVSTEIMYDTLPNGVPYPFDATCRGVSGVVDIGGGKTRTLNIWVQDWCWMSQTTGPAKAHYVDQTMVNALQAAFLASGVFNDIYDWVTAMIGSEWGPHPYADLIQPNDEITILLCDIEDDNSDNGGVIGFFWAKDNFKDGSIYQPNPGLPNYFPYHSHERIMFYIDAVMLANPSPAGYWADQVVSTLAHEFQHMINFYQKIVVAGAGQGPDTWINEMCSQAVEDLVADKLGIMGPRGVDGNLGAAGPQNNSEGRIPLFNAFDSVSLSNWGGSGLLQSYSASYAFGAYLTRNFGGAGLIRAMVQSPRTGAEQIVDSVSAIAGRQESLGDLLQKWSLAVLLSDRTDAPAGYQYNTGDFIVSSVGSASYSLGSINFFNYQQGTTGKTGPRLYSGNGLVGNTRPLPASGLLYLAGLSLTGKHAWSIDLPEGVSLSVVVK